MTPLPGALGGTELVAWRLDRERHAPTWESGEGAFQGGGRWNSAGVRAVYCAFDPSTSILEVAVHKGFDVLDTDPHTMTRMRIHDAGAVHVVDASSIPNSNWLRPGVPSAGAQRFGDDLLANHAFVAIPSAVSNHSWNLIFVASRAVGLYSLIDQERFALDTRLNPPAK